MFTAIIVVPVVGWAGKVEFKKSRYQEGVGPKKLPISNLYPD